MVPYIVCFGSTILLAVLANNIKFVFGEHRIQKLNTLFWLTSIFILCYLAAVRDTTIGYDMRIYGERLFREALDSQSLLEFWRWHVNTEPLFAALVYFSAQYFNRYVYYFLIQLFCVLPVFLLLRRTECKKYAWLGVLIYCFWLYPFSFNIMRQTIAIAICLWGYKYVLERKPIKYVITVIVAAGFHLSAFLALSVYIINLVTVCGENERSYIRKKINKYRSLIKAVFVIGIATIFIGGASVINMIIRITGKFQGFISDTTNIDIEWQNVVFMAAVILLLLLCKGRTKNQEMQFFIYLLLVGMIVYQFKAFSTHIYRASMYLTSYMIYAFPLFFSQMKSKFKTILLISTCVPFGAYFVYYNILHLWNAIYPYTSSFLGIE